MKETATELTTSYNCYEPSCYESNTRHIVALIRIVKRLVASQNINLNEFGIL